MKQDTKTNSPIIPFFKGDEYRGESACEQRASALGFTLVELIVVITILAVLGTIAFFSFQSYTVYARDVVRLSNLKNIESGLQIQYTQGGNYAVPDDFVNITASGTIIRQQGVFGTNALRTIKANKDASKDPLTEQYYDYVTDAYQSEYQLVGYMESDETMNVGTVGLLSLQGTHASGTGFIMKTLGQDMGMVSTGGVDLHRTESNVGQSFDIRNNAGVEYKIVFDETDEIISSSGSDLFSNVYNRSKGLLKNKELAKLDGSLKLYLDMRTVTGDGKLKDFSYNGNDAGCFEGVDHHLYGGSRVEYNCGEGGPYIDNVDGMIFDGDSDNISFPDPGIGSNDWTVEFKGNVGNNQNLSIFNPRSNGLDQWIFFQNNTRKIGLRLAESGDTGERIQLADYEISESGEFHFILQRTESNVNIYINGYKVGELDDSQPNGGWNGEWIVGMRWTGQFAHAGTIERIRIFDRVLSEKEIGNIYGDSIKEYNISW